MKEKIQKFREYLDYIERHYDNVQKAWALINEKCPNGFRFIYDDFVWHSIDAAIKSHDQSKLSAQEFTQYRNYFFPIEGEQKDEAAFDLAWRHHLENNEHHWETWVKMASSTFADYFIVQTACDWIAMGFEFNDRAIDYYSNNKHKIKIPEYAENLLILIFEYVYDLKSK